MNRVSVCGNVTHSFELVQESYDLVRLLKEVYLAAFVVPRPSFDFGALLKLSCAAMHFVEGIVCAYRVCRLQ